MAAELRVLAISVVTGRVGYVFLIGETLKSWGVSRRASRSTRHAAEQVQDWIKRLQPDVVITERFGRTRKGEKSQQLTAAIAGVAERNKLLDIALSRLRCFRNKYLHAAELAKAFPELLPILPRKRRIWESQPHHMVVFEALGLMNIFFEGRFVPIHAH